MKILVTYYSRTGHTQRIAQAIADQCGADIERLRDRHSRKGVVGYLRSGWEAMSKRSGAIHSISKDPANYDFVFIGTPVWAMHLAAPMRAYLADQTGKFERLAFFCTEGGMGSETAFKEMTELVGLEPEQTLVITEPDLQTNFYLTKTNEFMRKLDFSEPVFQALAS